MCYLGTVGTLNNKRPLCQNWEKLSKYENRKAL